jgi:hypothetical protein
VRTEREILLTALNRSSLPETLLEQFHSIVKILPIDKRLHIAEQLRSQTVDKKVDNVIQNFVKQYLPKTTSKLRSGVQMYITKGEYRILAVGEEIPVDVVVDGIIRKGGSASVRRVVHGGSFLALKSLKREIGRETFLREINVRKDLYHHHIVSLFASIQDADGLFLLLIEP